MFDESVARGINPMESYNTMHTQDMDETCTMEKTAGKIHSAGFTVEIVNTGLGPYLDIKYKGQQITLSTSDGDHDLHLYHGGVSNRKHYRLVKEG